jgi:hypothetical protein
MGTPSARSDIEQETPLVLQLRTEATTELVVIRQYEAFAVALMKGRRVRSATELVAIKQWKQ